MSLTRKPLPDLPLFTPEEKRDEAVERVARNNAWWIEEHALPAIDQARRSGEPFTTDDVWPLVPAPPEPRAMGAAMTQARSRGWIRPTDMWKESTRPEAHARPVRVWAPA